VESTLGGKGNWWRVRLVGKATGGEHARLRVCFGEEDNWRIAPVNHTMQYNEYVNFSLTLLNTFFWRATG
jgi:hypothetical protein